VGMTLLGRPVSEGERRTGVDTLALVDGPRTSPVAEGITAIDTMMANRAMVTSAYLIHAREPALIETGPTTSLEAVLAGLGALGMGPEDLAHVIVTHIHLDHAGGVGRLAEHFPKATVWVHERGAPHLADPTKLVQSAGRVYGEERLAELFGPVDPVASDRIRSIAEGDEIRLGDRSVEVLYTPGHASHHVALVDSGSGALFTGDALGIHLPDVRVLRPATPPPDIDIELAEESIARIRSRAGSVLMFSHYGPVTEVDELCQLASKRLRTWADVVHDAMQETDDIDRIAELLTMRTASEFEDALPGAGGVDGYEILSSMKMNASGLVRYWQKREAARSAAPGAEGDRPR
jgi:glyoxylase-like metal-dependent hydrolase (beta-lactamase superfamily II)